MFQKYINPQFVDTRPKKITIQRSPCPRSSTYSSPIFSTLVPLEPNRVSLMTGHFGETVYEGDWCLVEGVRVARLRGVGCGRFRLFVTMFRGGFVWLAWIVSGRIAEWLYLYSQYKYNNIDKKMCYIHSNYYSSWGRTTSSRTHDYRWTPSRNILEWSCDLCSSWSL